MLHNNIPVLGGFPPSVVGDAEGAGVGSTCWIIFKFVTLKGPMVPLFTASISSASSSFVMTGVVKNRMKDTIILPSLVIKKENYK